MYFVSYTSINEIVIKQLSRTYVELLVVHIILHINFFSFSYVECAFLIWNWHSFPTSAIGALLYLPEAYTLL